MIFTKQGDTELHLTVNMDLTGSDVRVIVKPRTGDPTVLEHDVTDPETGAISADPSGLAAALYRLEVEVTQGSTVVTFPSDGYQSLRILPDLD